MTRARAESWIPEDRVARIVRAHTTRKEIIEWFGPPVAVAHRGEVLQVPGMTMRRINSQEVKADMYFELFADRIAAGKSDLIYYYQSAELRGTGVSFLGMGSIQGEVQENRLWILVDGATGIVRDFVHRYGDADPARSPLEAAVESADKPGGM